jgi:hypothetical protein
VNCLAWLRPALRPLSVNEAKISCRRPVHGDLGPPGNDLICYSCKILEPCWLQREVLLAIGRGLRDLSAPKGKVFRPSLLTISGSSSGFLCRHGTCGKEDQACESSSSAAASD